MPPVTQTHTIWLALSVAALMACSDDKDADETSADATTDVATVPTGPVACNANDECPKGQYCKLGFPVEAKGDSAVKVGICAKMVATGVIDADPPNPGGGGTGGAICNGNFTLGQTQNWGPALLGQACSPKNLPKNCADGTWINFPAKNKCYCIAKCETLGKKPDD